MGDGFKAIFTLSQQRRNNFTWLDSSIDEMGSTKGNSFEIMSLSSCEESKSAITGGNQSKHNAAIDDDGLHDVFGGLERPAKNAGSGEQGKKNNEVSDD